MGNSKILRVKIQNVLGIEVVEINPEGNVITIGGANEAGKSSVLNAMMMTLGGKKAEFDEPLRRGATQGFATIELDDLIVTKTWTEGVGSKLTVTNADGAKFTTPQRILNKLVGLLTFDPMAFTTMSASDQAATLQELLGKDFTTAVKAVDDKIQVAYDARADFSRDLKRLGRPEPVEPVERIEVAELLNEKVRLEKFNEQQNVRAENMAIARERLEEQGRTIDSRVNQIADLKEVLERERAIGIEMTETYNDMPQPEPLMALDAVHAKLASIDETNSRATAYEAYRQVVDQSDALTGEVNAKSGELADLRRQRETLFHKAEFPVDGLGLADGSVTLDGLPFNQASSAARLKVSVAMGLAANPELRILFVRNGSLLDSTHLALLDEMAAERDGQVWIEVVDENDTCQVTIVDGRVKGQVIEAVGKEAA